MLFLCDATFNFAYKLNGGVTLIIIFLTIERSWKNYGCQSSFICFSC